MYKCRCKISINVIFYRNKRFNKFRNKRMRGERIIAQQALKKDTSSFCEPKNKYSSSSDLDEISLHLKNMNFTEENSKNYIFYLKNKDSYLKDYQGKYILIYDEEFKDCFDTFNKACKKALENNYKLGNFLVQKCSEKPKRIRRIGL